MAEPSAPPSSARAAGPSGWARLARAVQPRNPVFWLMLLVNALSTALAWVARAQPLNTLGVVIVVVFAVGNALLGMVLLWRLVRSEPAAAVAPLGG